MFSRIIKQERLFFITYLANMLITLPVNLVQIFLLITGACETFAAFVLFQPAFCFTL